VSNSSVVLNQQNEQKLRLQILQSSHRTYPYTIKQLNALPSMADPLSLCSNIAAVLQFSATVIKYLRDVGDVQDDLRGLQAEFTSAVGILSILKELVATEDAWLVSLQSLSVPNGPLEQCWSSLKRLAEKIPPALGFKKVLTWSFQKGEIRDILRAVERQNILFNLALETDHL
jgi:hypothetical protein